MTRYAVGEPVTAPAIPPGAEGAHLSLRLDAGAELLILLPDPTVGEVEAVRHGEAHFAWVDAEHSGLLCYRFDPGLPWSDTGYSPHREAGAAGIGAGSRLLLTVVLIDTADSNRVVVIRGLTWSPHFTGVVRDQVARMADGPWDEARADRAVTYLYRRHADTASLVQVALAACRGGS